jgi:hypothetical protein
MKKSQPVKGSWFDLQDANPVFHYNILHLSFLAVQLFVLLRVSNT